MTRKVLTATTLLMLFALILPGTVFGRMSLEMHQTKDFTYSAQANPAYCMTQHNVGKIVLAVTNYGTFGDGFAIGASSDCFTGARVFSCEYPKGSRSQYTFASAFWVGAVVGRDTLVSQGADGWLQGQELHPDESPFGDMIYRSIMDPTKPEFEGAVSEQDYVAVYTDTFTQGVSGLANDEVDGRPHRPLNIEITQRSYAWSYPYAEDFVLFDYSIKNIGTERLNQVYMGVYCDADVQPDGSDEPGYTDDICGFIETMPTEYGGGNWIDTVNIAWIADDDGELNAGTETRPLPNVTATRIVRTPSDSLDVSFNWWVSNGNSQLDFGPQRKGHVRDLISHGGLGTPSGDRNKYYFMRNNEFDYDQVYTASISPDNPDWVWPNQAIAKDISNGFDTRYLLSFGPFNIDPGQTLPLSFAYVGGENLHTDPTNADTYLSAGGYNPDQYYENLDFSDLALNAVWASWVYDNPGVDSDTNDYAGEYRFVCQDSVIDSIDNSVTPPDTIWEYSICDTVWYKGDGVPDFRGASPPPAPWVWVEPSVGEIRVRWNGLRSESTKDVFSREFDFEGYRVYVSRDERESSYSMLASYDVQDYNKYVFSAARGEWQLKDTPFKLEELICLYGESCDDEYFDPEDFTRNHPYTLDGFPDSVFYFEAQDYNRFELGLTTPITKIYPDAPYPASLNPDSAAAEDLTDDGYLKYFEYEYTIENLLSTVPYYVSVTAFDYGSPQSGLGALETSKTVNALVTYPQPTAEDVAANPDAHQVYIYPNPYVGTGSYLAKGFEGRGTASADPNPDRERRIHFANLPAKCTIRIYSLDGDMIRELDHDVDPADPTASHDTWDMITRNTQSVVSGTYYWTVEDTEGNTQIGKLVVIM